MVAQTVFWIVAVAASGFYGWKAADIFDVKTTGRPWAWKVHQFWFNFAGAIVGWAALWSLLPRSYNCLTTTCIPEARLADALLFFLAFVGVTGHLPATVIGLVAGVKELVAKLTGALK